MSKDMIVMKNGRKFYISSRNVTEVKNRFKKFNEERHDLEILKYIILYVFIYIYILSACFRYKL